jgi:ubiquinone/menaquinone biosynthesis C-methylase UbiE
MTTETAVPVGNVYDKYHSDNPITRWLMRRFFSAFDDLTGRIAFDNVLEVGCGEGELLRHLLERHEVEVSAACDIEEDILRKAAALNPTSTVNLGNIEQLDYPDDSYDLVIACEVLEHVENPYQALRELVRVSRRHVLISVPCEPLWRVLNVLRGRYLRDLGNTPGHIQHWSAWRFVSLAATALNVRQVRRPLPWTMLLGEVRDVGGWV